MIASGASSVRILLDYRPALRERTGVGEYVHELARALAASAPPDEALVLFSASWKDRLTAAPAGLPIIDRAVPGKLLNLAWHRLERPAVETLTGQTFDVVQAAHPLLIPSTGAAQVITIHDLDFLDHPERTRAEIRRDYPTLAAAHARRAHAIVAVSHATADAVVDRLGVSREQIVIASPGAPDWPPREQEPADGCILFLGTIEPRKNLGVLLDAYERLLSEWPDAPTLVLAGGVRPDSAGIAARAAEPPLAGKVELPGYVVDDKRLDLYRRALVFVMPSHAEGFGIPALEALTVGVPVIAANRGALPEVVGAAGSLVDADDAPGLAAEIRAVLSDAGRRERMREAGWRQARTFTWAHTAANTRQAWRAAIAARRTRHA